MVGRKIKIPVNFYLKKKWTKLESLIMKLNKSECQWCTYKK